LPGEQQAEPGSEYFAVEDEPLCEQRPDSTSSNWQLFESVHPFVEGPMASRQLPDEVQGERVELGERDGGCSI
jgi:hypothetical protein